MSHLILILALVSIEARAYDDVPMYPTYPESQSRELQPILDQPQYQPQTYPSQPLESDSEWTRSVQQMERETQPRR